MIYGEDEREVRRGARDFPPHRLDVAEINPDHIAVPGAAGRPGRLYAATAGEMSEIFTHLGPPQSTGVGFLDSGPPQRVLRLDSTGASSPVRNLQTRFREVSSLEESKVAQLSRSAALLASILAAPALYAPTANAVPVMTASATAVIDGAVSADSGTSATQATAQLLDVSRAEWNIQAASSASGQLGVSTGFLGASGRDAELTAVSTWTETFDYSGGAATFDFFIAEAILGFEANNVRGLKGSFEVEISLNGVALFSAGAAAVTIASTPSDPTGIDLTLTGPLTATFDPNITDGPNPGGAGYRFAPFTGSLDLSPLTGSNTLVYSMTVNVDGLIGETGAKASIGDPLNLDLQPPGALLTFDSGPGPTPVTEPGTLALLLLGLAALRLGRPRGRI